MPTRKRQRRKEARPGEIIAAGLAEFAEHGFAAARLTDIADRAGIAKGTIYLYFKNKDELFAEAVQARVLSVFDEMAGMIDAHDGPTEALLEGLLDQAYRRFVSSDARVIMKVLISEGHRFPDLVRLYHASAIQQGVSLLRKVVARGIARGEVRPELAEQDVRIVIAPAIFAAFWSLVFDEVEPLDLNHFKAAHLDLLMRGLKAEPAS